MNKVLSQQPQQLLPTTTYNTSASASPTMSESSPPQPQFRQPTKRAHSPHIMDQALSVAPLRKPVQQMEMASRSTPAVNVTHSESRNNSPMGGNKYEFESTPTPSARNSLRNSFIDPAMDPQVRLEEYDWPELEEQFTKRMEAFKAVEEGIWEEWREWGEVFKVSLIFCAVVPHGDACSLASYFCVLSAFLGGSWRIIFADSNTRHGPQLYPSTTKSAPQNACAHGSPTRKHQRRIWRRRESIVSSSPNENWGPERPKATILLR